jgi:hypothetical protein
MTTDRPYTDNDLQAQAALCLSALSTSPTVADILRWLPGAYVEGRSGNTWGDVLDNAGLATVARKIHALIGDAGNAVGGLNAARWLIDLGADGLEPSEQQLTLGAGEPRVRIHFAFAPDMSETDRRDFVAEIAAATGTNADALRAFCGPDFEEIAPEDRTENPDASAAVRESKHGTWRGLEPGYWVVKIGEEFYEESPADFAAQFEPVLSAVPAPAACDCDAEVHIGAGFWHQPRCATRQAAASADLPAGEAYRLAVSAALRLGTGANWEAIRDRAEDLTAEVQGLTEAHVRQMEATASVDRAAVLNEAADHLTRQASSASPAARDVILADAAELRSLAADHPRRGDEFEAWLKAQRDEHPRPSHAWFMVDCVLDTYRLHADTGTPLAGHVCEGKVAGDCECLEKAAVVPAGAGEEPADETREVCEGFQWIGQPFRSCDRCGQPAWEHVGEDVPVEGAGPFDNRRTVRPWGPGEADRIRAKWAPAVSQPGKEH